MSKRIIVVGEPCIDVIHKADGRMFNEHGGISYSVVASSILDEDFEIVPVIGLHEADAQYFLNLFSQLSNVNLSGIYATGIRTRRVDLFYEDENQRWECSTVPAEPTPLNRILNFLPADGIHVNLISGADIALNDLQSLRKASMGAIIHLDLHNIVMQHLPNGKRVRASREDYLSWCECADTVQLNEEEAKVIDRTGPSFDVLAGKILSAGPRVVIITLAERGMLFYQKENKGFTKKYFLPQKVDVVDPTGSGDVLGAAFLHHIVSGLSFLEAAQKAFDMAVLKTGVAGPSGMLRWIGNIKV
ncbi:MAG: carbohydrate kinase family protein [Candidatus Kryptoniota bacterium]